MIPLQEPGAKLSRVVLASNNPKKLAELQRVFAAEELPIVVKSLADFPAYPEPAETARDFAGNALIKAREAAARTGVTAIADDSGIEVDVLNLMPGVRSARWAGPACDDQANLDLLLAQLADVPVADRRARFVCALAMATPGGAERVWNAKMEGQIALQPSGQNGFGYDPIFIPEGHIVTSAELSAEEKDAISHRGKAIRLLVADLRRLLGEIP